MNNWQWQNHHTNNVAKSNHEIHLTIIVIAGTILSSCSTSKNKTLFVWWVWNTGAPDSPSGIMTWAMAARIIVVGATMSWSITQKILKTCASRMVILIIEAHKDSTVGRVIPPHASFPKQRAIGNMGVLKLGLSYRGAKARGLPSGCWARNGNMAAGLKAVRLILWNMLASTQVWYMARYIHLNTIMWNKHSKKGKSMCLMQDAFMYMPWSGKKMKFRFMWMIKCINKWNAIHKMISQWLAIRSKKFHLIMNVAVGGNWGGMQGVDESIWPQRMEVDYVRVYQWSTNHPLPNNSFAIIPRAANCPGVMPRWGLSKMM